jgi:hypothetical protein
MDEIRKRNLAASPDLKKVSPNGVRMIVAAVKCGNEVTGYKLFDGKIISRQQGEDLARSGSGKHTRPLSDDTIADILERLPIVYE